MPAVAIIDKEDSVCDQAGSYFRRAGFTVRSAKTSDAGVALLRHERFDLVVVDLLLRDASGTLISQVAANMNAAVLLTTGHEDAAPWLRQLNFPHLLKPFDETQLFLESARVMGENRQAILRVILNLERVHRGIADLKAATADARRLIAASRAILARADQSKPVTAAPRDDQFDPFSLILLADQQVALGRTEQARTLIDAGYKAYDQHSLGEPPEP